jgi:uncharacterized protein YidB (DUF937 family)
MGILDSILGAVGGGGESNPMSAITDMLGAHQGGLGGIIGSLEQAGLGDVAKSWVGTGGNLAISPEQIQAVLGSGPVAAFAQKLGIDPSTAAEHLAQLLPQVVDHLTPNGEVPSGALGALEGLLGKLKG